jgi:DNA helicase-2/ATP-dependent DNA helicase PcrA
MAAATIEAMATSLDAVLGLSAFRVPQRTETDWPAFVDLFADLHSKSAWPADLEQVSSGMTAPGACSQGRTIRGADLLTGYPSRQRFLTDRSEIRLE